MGVGCRLQESDPSNLSLIHFPISWFSATVAKEYDPFDLRPYTESPSPLANVVNSHAMRPQDYVDLYQLEDTFWWFAGMRDITAALLDPILANRDQSLRVLDAGCGTGANLDWLRRYAAEENIIGIDLSAQALGFCQRRGKSLLVNGSITKLPFAEASFDLVTSFDVLIYPPGADADNEALREMHRVLKPGGICFVRAAAYQWLYGSHDKATNGLRRYGLRALTTKVEGAKLRVLRSTYLNSVLFPAAMLHRLVIRRTASLRDSDVKPFSRRSAWINKPLSRLLSAEASLLKLRHSKLPFGLSAICIARKQR